MARFFNLVFVYAVVAILATLALGSPTSHHKAHDPSKSYENAPKHHLVGSGPSYEPHKKNSGAHPVINSGAGKAKESARAGRQYGGYYPGGYGGYPYGNYGNFGSAQASASASASSNSFGFGK